MPAVTPPNPVPLTPEKAPLVLAPAPVIDRYPIIRGRDITGDSLSATYRLCNTGWRYTYVDLLNELLEHDGHARGVVRQRVLAVAGASIDINPPKLPKGHPDEELASEIAEFFAMDFEAIPSLSQSLGQLNWAVIYGLTGAETEWNIDPDLGWEPTALSNIHSRRLNYSDPMSWDLYIYDQGLVGPGFYMGPTVSMRGLRVANYPGKFITHAPALNGDYVTRDGEGRYIGVLMMLKRMIMRATAQDFERVIRPWVVGYFNREVDAQTKVAIATEEDEQVLTQATQALGVGALNAAVLPNSTKLEILRAASAMDVKDFLTFLNQEISKALLGQAFTTEPGANGNFAAMDIANKNTLKILRYDASALADTIRRDLAMPWMRLRYPEANRRLCPDVKLHVNELPDPQKIMTLIKDATTTDIPVDVDWAAEELGLTIVPKEEGMEDEPRRTRMVSAAKTGIEPGEDDPNEGKTPPAAEPPADDSLSSEDKKPAAPAKNGKAKPAAQA